MTDKISLYKSQIESLSEDIELMGQITSHDIKDPLRQALDDLEEHQDIKSATMHIREVIEMINLLREYSNLIKFKGELSDIDCNKILQCSLEELSEYISNKNAVITYDELPQIKAFEPYMHKIFQSLIKNAICFNDSAEPKLHINCKKEGDYWQFKFSDNGIGIESFYKKYVFALFQKLDEEHKSEGYGTGLAFSKKIIENYGGKIWFESDGENGTDFYFTLPQNN